MTEKNKNETICQTVSGISRDTFEIYTHIPFCRQKCRYCDFASYPAMEHRAGQYIDAVLSEAASRRYLVNKPVSTIYIGGGTPSLLEPESLKRLCNGLMACFSFTEEPEWSAEANPGTLTEDWLLTSLRAGINRLSLGAQAFQDHLLKMLGRIHCKDEIVQSVKMARKSGFDNISMDLMFGLPGQTMTDWRETLDEAIRLEPRHISAYGLIPEEGTPLYRDLQTKRLSLPEAEAEREMYDLLKETLNRYGYVQYEISNFALPGYACRHNIGYWKQNPYLGLGASSASMHSISADADGITYIRETNPSDIDTYIGLIENSAANDIRSFDRAIANARERIRVDAAEARFETMMLGLRMNTGVSDAEFERMHHRSIASIWGDTLERLRAGGLIEHNRGRWILTDKGMDLQNTVLVELMD